MEDILTFSAIYGKYNSESLEIKVKDGKICCASLRTYHYDHGTTSGFYVEPEDKYFDRHVQEAIRDYYLNCSQYKYEKFIELLDQETLDKYFKKSYLPK